MGRSDPYKLARSQTNYETAFSISSIQLLDLSIILILSDKRLTFQILTFCYPFQ